MDKILDSPKVFRESRSPASTLFLMVAILVAAFFFVHPASVHASATVNCTGSGDAGTIQSALNSNSAVVINGTCAIGGTTISFGSNESITGSATINYTGSGYAMASAGDNNTVSGLTLNGGGIDLDLNSGQTGQYGWTITNNTFRNITSGNNGVYVTNIIGKGAASTISNNHFTNIWQGGYPANISDSDQDAINGSGVWIENGFDNVSLNGNVCDEIGFDCLKGFDDGDYGNTNPYVSHNVTMNNNVITRDHRIGIEFQEVGKGNCPGGCAYNDLNMIGLVVEGNYWHDPATPIGNEFAYSLMFGTTDGGVYANNTGMNEDTSCSVRLGIGLENAIDGGVIQGNVIGSTADSCNPSGWAAYEASGYTKSGYTNTFQNNIYCGANSSAAHNHDPGDSATNVYQGEALMNTCPGTSAQSVSSIKPSFTSANNQSVPAGSSATWNLGVISNLSVRNVTFYVDGVSVATQILSDYNSNFASTLTWLYHATLKGSSYSNGTHTITATATDVSGASQSVSQTFTVSGSSASPVAPTTPPTSPVVPPTNPVVPPATVSNSLSPASNLILQSPSESSMVLNWTDPSGATGYLVMRRETHGDTTAFTQVASLPAGSTGYLDTGLNYTYQYDYEIIAFNSTGQAAPSNIATYQVLGQNPGASAPSSLVTSPVSPANPISPILPIASQTVPTAPTTPTSPVIPPTIPVTSTSTLNLGTITAADIASMSTAQLEQLLQEIVILLGQLLSEVSGTGTTTITTTTGTPSTGTLPTASNVPSSVTNLTLQSPAQNAMVLSWTGSSGATGYLVVRRPTQLPAPNPFVQVINLPAGSTGYFDTGLNYPWQYDYEVIAYNAAGQASPSSAVTYQVLGQNANATAAYVPGAPTTLTAQSPSQSSMVLNWTDNDPNATSYLVMRRPTHLALPNPLVQVASLPAGSMGYTDTGLTYTWQYDYEIIAVDASGQYHPSSLVTYQVLGQDPNASAPSTPVSTPTTPTVPSTPSTPTAPTNPVVPPTTPATVTLSAASNLTLQSPSDSAMVLNWTGSSGATGYLVMSRLTNGGTTTFTQVASLPAGTTSYLDNGLNYTYQYDFEIIAFNSTGDAAPSNIATYQVLGQNPGASAPSGGTAPTQPTTPTASTTPSTPTSPTVPTAPTTPAVGISIKSDGATGNGSTDDATAIQNAINSCNGGNVLFPTGTYYVSHTLTLKAGCSYIAQGSPVIDGYTGTGGGGYSIFSIPSGTVTITGLTLNGGGIVVPTGEGTATVNMTGSTIENIKNSNANFGAQNNAIFSNGGTFLSGNISNNTIENIVDPTDNNIDTSKNGIVLYQVANLTISNNTFNNIDADAIALPYSSNITAAMPGLVVSNNTFTNLYRAAIEMQAHTLTNTIISGNHMSHWLVTGVSGFWGFTACISFAANGSPGAQINNNVCDNRGSQASYNGSGGLGMGLELAGSGLTANGNDVYQGGMWNVGIVVGDGPKATVSNNYVCGTYQYGATGYEPPFVNESGQPATFTNNTTPATCS